MDDYGQLANLWARVEERPQEQEPAPTETPEKKMLSQLIDPMREERSLLQEISQLTGAGPGMSVDADPAYVTGYMGGDVN